MREKGSILKTIKTTHSYIYGLDSIFTDLKIGSATAPLATPFQPPVIYTNRQLCISKVQENSIS